MHMHNDELCCDLPLLVSETCLLVCQAVTRPAYHRRRQQPEHHEPLTSHADRTPTLPLSAH